MGLQIEHAKLCRLTASGFASSHPTVEQWLEQVLIQIRATLAEGPVNAHLWSYRVDGSIFVACDLWQDGKSESIAITFLPGLRPDLSDVLQPQVPDMADALHMAGMVVGSVRATVTLGRRTGELSI